MTPLTPAVISKLPLGLLGFFGIKNGGQYPQTIAEVIAPTLEMDGMLAANYRELIAVSPIAALGFVTANIGASGLPAVVPASELWWVQAVSVLAFTGAGDSFTGTIELRNTQSGSASQWHRALSSPITQGANLSTLHPGTHVDGFWASPGDTFGIWYAAATNASGTAQMSINLSLTRFPF